MKFDKLLANYLYEFKELSLNGIGRFELDETFQLPADSEKGIQYPTQGIIFIYDRHAGVPDELKKYLSSQISKPASLIVSDLEEYLLQIKNMLNLGKPCTIEGIGTLTKLNDGSFEFSPGTFKVEKISSIVAAIANKETDFEITKPPTKTYKKSLLVAGAFIIIFGLILGAGWSIYKYWKGDQSAITDTATQLEVKDTLPQTTAIQSQAIINSEPAKQDTVRYKMFFLASKYKEKANYLFKQWSKTDKVNMDSAIMNDTLRYRLFIYKKVLPADTGKIKKQLEIYFKHAVFLEISK